MRLLDVADKNICVFALPFPFLNMRFDFDPVLNVCFLNKAPVTHYVLVLLLAITETAD
jgi:hypothetical protein